MNERDDFDQPVLNNDWIGLRGSPAEFSTLTERPGFLRLRLQPETLRGLGVPSFVARRQDSKSYFLACRLEFTPQEDECAGLALLQSNLYHLSFVRTRMNDEQVVIIRKCFASKETVLAVAPWKDHVCWLAVHAWGQQLSFFYGDEALPALLADGISSRFLSPDVAGGFVGTCMGAYASGKDRKRFADFDYIEYKPTE